jgi:hypothetical protein
LVRAEAGCGVTRGGDHGLSDGRLARVEAGAERFHDSLLGADHGACRVQRHFATVVEGEDTRITRELTREVLDAPGVETTAELIGYGLDDLALGEHGPVRSEPARSEQPPEHVGDFPLTRHHPRSAAP